MELWRVQCSPVADFVQTSIVIAGDDHTSTDCSDGCIGDVATSILDYSWDSYNG